MGLASDIGKEGINSPDGQVPVSSFLPETNPQPNPNCQLVPSFPASKSERSTDSELEQGERGGCNANPDPLTLSPEAYHGLFGEMLRVVEPETEAPPPAVLLPWLTLFGASIGRAAWVQVGARRHYPILFVGIVGRTSDAKGDSWSVARYPFALIDPAFTGQQIANGIGSGEGLIERIADEQTLVDRDGKAKVIPGIADKRLVVRLSELSRCFKMARRDGNPLSEYLREAWDGEPIHVPNRKGNALSTTDYSVSVVGDITPAVLQKLLASGTESVDGFANRFLWCVCRSEKSLPGGGDITVLDPFTDRLKAALEKAKGSGELKRSPQAEALWVSVYPSLKGSGDTVPHTDRARPYVVRLSLLYALADGAWQIEVAHLQAALAVWEYCRQSALTLFVSSDSSSPVPVVPDPLWLRLLSHIQAQQGISRSELLRAVREKAEAVGQSLDGLRVEGLAYPVESQSPNGGPKAERWFPGKPGKPDGNGEEGYNYHSPSPGPDPDPDGLVPSGTGKEGTNCPLSDPPAVSSFIPSTKCQSVREGVTIADTLPPPTEGVNSFLPDAERETEQRGVGIGDILPNAERQPDGGKVKGGENVVQPPDPCESLWLELVQSMNHTKQGHWPTPKFNDLARPELEMLQAAALRELDRLRALKQKPSPGYEQHVKYVAVQAGTALERRQRLGLDDPENYISEEAFMAELMTM